MSGFSQKTKGPENRRVMQKGHRPGAHAAEKPKDFKKSLKRLIRYLTRHKISLIIIVVLSVGSTAFAILGPKILGTATTELFYPSAAQLKAYSVLESALPVYEREQLKSGEIDIENAFLSAVEKVDEHQKQKLLLAAAQLETAKQLKIDFSKIANILLTVVGLYLVSSFISFVMQFILAKTSQTIVYDMRNEVSEKISKLPLKYFDDHTHGEILSRVTNDIDTISTSLSQSLSEIITSVVMLIGIMIMMFSISWVITIVCLLVLPASFIVTKYVVKRSQKHFKGQQEQLGYISGHVEEMYSAFEIVKAYGKEKDNIKKFDSINNKLYVTGWKAQFLSGLIMPLMNFLNNISYVFVCVIGGIMVIDGRINVGDVQAFIQYSRRFSQPITQVAQISGVLQSTLAAAERVFELLDENEMSQDVSLKTLPPAKGAVEFSDVSFGYLPGQKVIDGFNLKVNAGDLIAIVGHTGAGKTTLVNLLMRFYEIDSGAIFVDGVNIALVPREALRERFGIVLQDTWLFEGTVLENIAYGKLDASEHQIIKAAKMAHVDYFIRTLPHGYNAVLSQQASNISQGQRQLLAIARALLADPSILILDEATSSVDTRTEAYIQNAMIALMKGRTSFVIAHRLSTIRNASTILVMEGGKIVEQGNHEQLIKLKGHYAELYNSQFADSFAQS